MMILQIMQKVKVMIMEKMLGALILIMIILTIMEEEEILVMNLHLIIQKVKENLTILMEILVIVTMLAVIKLMELAEVLLNFSKRIRVYFRIFLQKLSKLKRPN